MRISETNLFFLIQCFNTSRHPYSSFPDEAFPCRNKTGEDGRTLPLAINFFKTALRVMFDIGMKGAVTNRYQDFKALLSSFCLSFLFQNLNFSSM